MDNGPCPHWTEHQTGAVHSLDRRSAVTCHAEAQPVCRSAPDLFRRSLGYLFHWILHTHRLRHHRKGNAAAPDHAAKVEDDLVSACLRKGEHGTQIGWGAQAVLGEETDPAFPLRYRDWSAYANRSSSYCRHPRLSINHIPAIRSMVPSGKWLELGVAHSPGT
jgi:hypothetical protein